MNPHPSNEIELLLMTKRRQNDTDEEKPAFFDLKIPYVVAESGKLLATRKKTRLKTLIKLVDLGYTEVADNHSIRGRAMSNSDFCTIPLSLVLQAAPNLLASMKFHRELLDVPFDCPFKKYTRLTISIDNLIQGKALSSGNLVLKTYDLVVVRYLNQPMFDHACNIAEVDLIAIDFSEKVPFRLDFHTVKDAIKRGIYFKITYSHVIYDVHTRRQMISNSKLLFEWSRGKNLIFISSAASPTEIREPYDVQNLSFLLGISPKRAKAAISNNCKLLLDTALRKKYFYKNAFEERISTEKTSDSNNAWSCDGDDWDYVSRGEGDLVFDEFVKCFSTSEVAKAPKVIDFGSVESNGFLLEDILRPCKVAKT